MNDRLRATGIDFLGWVEYQGIPQIRWIFWGYLTNLLVRFSKTFQVHGYVDFFLGQVAKRNGKAFPLDHGVQHISRNSATGKTPFRVTGLYLQG